MTPADESKPTDDTGADGAPRMVDGPQIPLWWEPLLECQTVGEAVDAWAGYLLAGRNACIEGRADGILVVWVEPLKQQPKPKPRR